MFQNPLVITDNASLCSKFLEISKNLIPEISFSISISPFSDSTAFSNDVRVINMKDYENVSFIMDNFDIIISLHCKQLFPERLVKNKRCINIHPGYNPINRGWYPQVFSIIHDLEIGATIHEITAELDNGPIIAREKVDKYIWDTSSTLYNRILDKEIELIKANLYKIIHDDYETLIPEDDSNLFLKRDFEKLKKINLEKQATYGEVINRLRALSHSGYKNAYFETKKGEKVYISLNLHKDE